MLTLRPLFPGKTEGSQIIEQIAILGLPSEQELLAMSDQMSDQIVQEIMKIDSMPKKHFQTILPKD